jgi:pilus assembly protein CpaC
LKKSVCRLKRNRIVSWIVLINLLIVPFVFSQDAEMKLMIDEMEVVLAQGLKRVAIANPGIAGIKVISDKEVMVVGKSTGTTTLIIWDKTGKKTISITVIKENIEKKMEQIRRLLKSVNMTTVAVTAEGDKIFLSGVLERPEDMDVLKGVIAPFSGLINLVKIKERQPLIKIGIRVLEIKREAKENLGVSWLETFPVTYSISDIAWPEFRKDIWKLEKLWHNLTLGFADVDDEALLAQINLLAQEGAIKMLANPTLVALDDKEAEFLVGGEVPVITRTGEGDINVEYKEYGISLNIRSKVMGEDEVKTILKAAVSELDTSAAIDEWGWEIPAFLKRSAQTELYLKDGSTIILAGLIRNRDSEIIKKFPFLGDVPVLGKLFKSKSFQDENTELIITVTPRIVKDETKKQASTVYEDRAQIRPEIESGLSSYSRLLQEKIGRALRYPPGARGQKGRVVVGLYILSNGQLQDAVITQSSGKTILDRAAIAAVKQLSPYPPFPAGLELESLQIEIPIVYEEVKAWR